MKVLDLGHRIPITLDHYRFHIDVTEIHVSHTSLALPTPKTCMTTCSLSDAGIGLAGVYEAEDWRMSLEWRNGEPSTYEPDKEPRFWAQAGWRF